MRYVTQEPIAIDAAGFARLTADGSAGAVVAFLGIVRADRLAGRTVRALCYEAHAEMVNRQVERWVHEATRRWRLAAVAVRHRVGRVEVGEASVCILVSSAHRAQAYAASQFLLERIKHDAPIWKRELYDDGSSRWSACAAASVHADV